MPGRKRTYEKAARKRRQQQERLRQSAEHYINMVLTELPEVDRAKLFSSSVRDSRTAIARYLCFAVLFHVVLKKRNRNTIQEYCDMSLMTVSDGIKRVSRAVRSRRKSVLQIKAHAVCRQLGIRPMRLTFVGAARYNKKRKQPRPR